MLCRCGKSQTKPFCDKAHRETRLRVLPAGRRRAAGRARARPTRACRRPSRARRSCPGPVLAAPFHLAGEVGDVSRLQPRRQPDLGALRAGAGRARGRRRRRCSPPAWRRSTRRCETTLRPGDVLVAPERRLPRHARDRARPPRAARDRGAPRPDRRRRGARRRCPARPSCSSSRRRTRRSTCSTSRAIAPRRRGAGRGRQHAGRPAAPAPCSRSAPTSRRQRDEVPHRPQRHQHGLRRRRATRAAALREWRSADRRDPGPFETWLAHRSLATYAAAPGAPDGQRARAGASCCASAREVGDVRYPGLGAVVVFTLASSAGGAALPRRVRARHRGDELRRPALDRRAPRALGHRRHRRGLHPLLVRDRGHRRPARRRRGGALDVLSAA